MENQEIGIGSRVKHPDFGPGVIIQLTGEAYEIVFMEHGWRKILRSFEGLEVIDAMEPDRDLVSYSQVEDMMVKVIRRFSDVQETVDLGDKWKGGKLILEPGRTDLSSKEIPINAFFHKIVMVRDRLRVMEQRINSSNLEEEEKVNLQQYLTRIYGSLTSFNVLFQFKSDQFTGERGK
ncbi:MAG: hypothetical protein B6D64_04150 [Bacteroidetes bacterium 4484_276]|nr:MAG: hypothetical protein B6D64_04150 [Bacteroidetes bacterium 4484_276]OYT14147.1 MAG: hypothetical protein B6I19_01450 [Bacteroidetes bacterium 4572_114]